jgi:adenylosuccinate lyase
MREKGTEHNDLMDRLAADSRIGLSADELRGLLAEPLTFTGAARDQVAAVVGAVEAVLATDPSAAGYQPEPLL